MTFLEANQQIKFLTNPENEGKDFHLGDISLDDMMQSEVEELNRDWQCYGSTLWERVIDGITFSIDVG